MLKQLSFPVILLTLIVLNQTLFGQQRGVGINVKDGNGTEREVKLYEGSYALIIGNSEYAQGWDRLSGVKSDVIAVRNILERHGFNVETEENLTSEKFETRIRKFVNDYGYNRNNRRGCQNFCVIEFSGSPGIGILPSNMIAN